MATTTRVRERFLLACRRQPVDATPVWFMRQAGRYLPEYRRLRGDTDVLSLTRDPEAAAEVALQPVRRMDVDAAILFSDIMVPIAAAGVDVRIVANQGPTLAEPFRSDADVARLRPLEPPEDVPYTLETIRILLGELAVPLIGFAGAPFTLASYLVEGAPSRDHARTKALMHGRPETWRALMVALCDHVVLPYLRAQIAAGVHAVQLFDSWAGALDPDDYRDHVLPWSRRILESLEAEGVGVDWRTPLDVAWERVGADAGIQGNLDPAALLGPWDVVARKAEAVLMRAGGRPGPVFHLRHGGIPSTPPDHLARLVDLVHQRTAAR